MNRLGNPLVNEVIIPTGLKDEWNARQPWNDAKYRQYYTAPILAKVINSLYKLGVPETNRDDLVAVLLTGVPELNFTGSKPADILRLNTRIPVTANPNRLGVLGGDTQGWPNGRRLGDDVIDIAEQAVGGFLKGTKLPLGDGVNADDVEPAQGVPLRGRPEVRVRQHEGPAEAVAPGSGGSDRRSRPNRSARTGRRHIDRIDQGAEDAQTDDSRVGGGRGCCGARPRRAVRRRPRRAPPGRTVRRGRAARRARDRALGLRPRSRHGGDGRDARDGAARAPARRRPSGLARPRVPAPLARDGRPHVPAPLRARAEPRAGTAAARRVRDPRARQPRAHPTRLPPCAPARARGAAPRPGDRPSLRRRRRCPARARPLRRGVRGVRPHDGVEADAGLVRPRRVRARADGRPRRRRLGDAPRPRRGRPGSPSRPRGRTSSWRSSSWAPAGSSARRGTCVRRSPSSPATSPALEQRARVEAARGELGRATATARRAATAVPLPQLVALHADLLDRLGRTAAAAATAAARCRDRASARARTACASTSRPRCYRADHGIEPRRTVALARRARADRPSIHGDDALGWALARAGTLRRGRPLARPRAPARHPDALLFFHRGYAAGCAGDRAEMRAWYRRALALDPSFSVRWAPVAARLATTNRSLAGREGPA